MIIHVGLVSMREFDLPWGVSRGGGKVTSCKSVRGTLSRIIPYIYLFMYVCVYLFISKLTHVTRFWPGTVNMQLKLICVSIEHSPHQFGDLCVSIMKLMP